MITQMQSGAQSAVKRNDGTGIRLAQQLFEQLIVAARAASFHVRTA
jgi:hypothetical protein